MRRKQTSQESVGIYAQCFEQLFEQSYGNRKGMDSESKSLLKRNLFTQGLLRKWQEKISPFASTFHDALFQARAAEDQEHMLSELHGHLFLKPNLPHSTSLPQKGLTVKMIVRLHTQIHLDHGHGFKKPASHVVNWGTYRRTPHNLSDHQILLGNLQNLQTLSQYQYQLMPSNNKHDVINYGKN